MLCESCEKCGCKKAPGSDDRLACVGQYAQVEHGNHRCLHFINMIDIYASSENPSCLSV
jgi:hypothetical protein